MLCSEIDTACIRLQILGGSKPWRLGICQCRIEIVTVYWNRYDLAQDSLHLLERGSPSKNDNAVHPPNRVDRFAGKPRSNGSITIT